MKKKLTALLLILVMLLGCLTPVTAATGIQINKESLTLESGGSYQLQVTVNGKKAQASWGSSNTSVASVSSSGKVTGKAAGSAIITAMVNGGTIECLVSVLKKSKQTTTRYNVLILDASGSMKGKPDSSQKQAAKRFCSKVLATSGNNYVAVVSLHSGSSVVCGFTDNYGKLVTAINKVKSNGDTNMNSALATAGKLLDGISKKGSNVMKNIILCSDGLPTKGSAVSSGRYSKKDHKRYRYANSTYNTATKLKKKNYFIYALGFFHSSKGNDLKFGKRLMKDLASKDKYYVINKTEDLDDVFDDIANKITKVTMNKSSITINKGSKYQLYAMKNGSKKKASWKSSNSSVASVNSSGKVTGKKAGTATITATIGGKKITCKVTVKNKVSLTLNKSKITLYVGEKATLKATKKGTKSKVSWKSSKSSVASVSSSGVVTAKKAGTAIVTATVSGVSKKCTVVVKKPSHPIHSMHFKYKDSRVSGVGMTDEHGLHIVANDEAVIEKCGAYIYKSGSYWHCVMAFKGRNVKEAQVAAYLSYKGKVVCDAMSSSRLCKYSMQKDSDGIWSMWGKWKDVYFNVFSVGGANVVNGQIGSYGTNTKMFTDLNKMKKWLKS